MGRETKILLAFLGLLAGVFCGVLSMKLLVPRPPAGAGPDIHGAGTFPRSTVIVDPPLLPLRAADFAAAPPLVAEGLAGTSQGEPSTARLALAARANHDLAVLPTAAEAEIAGNAADGDLLPPPAEFVLAPPARAIDEVETASLPAAPRDPFISHTAWNPPEELPDIPAASPQDISSAAPAPVPLLAPSAPLAGSHIVRAGDSWWSLAETAYGDGRLYRALFAWNRAIDPRIALAAGTQLEVPPLEKLRAAWPKLVPPTGP
jgi:nucleoid-associated protein YgaU